MNSFIQAQCKLMIEAVESFEVSCEIAAFQDDGKISSSEAKALKKIRHAASKFKSELEKI